MTRRQRLEMVIRKEITEELIEDCKIELAKLLKKNDENAQRAREQAKTPKTEQLEAKIVELISEKPRLAAELTEEFKGLTRNKISATCTNLVKEGRIKVRDIKVKSKGIRKEYYID